MKLTLCFALLIFLTLPAIAQSGRKGKIPSTPPPTPEVPVEKSPPKSPDPPTITAEKNEVYSCTDDGTLARIIDPEQSTETVYTPKTVDVKAEITARPRPSYTREARRANIQGYVILSIVLTADGHIGPIKVLRGLPSGLTANAIRASCKIEFKPAQKAGKTVSQSINVEYAFRLSDPLISGP